MIRKLIRIGNSQGITLDKKILKQIGLDGVTWVKIEPDVARRRIVIKKRGKNEW